MISYAHNTIYHFNTFSCSIISPLPPNLQSPVSYDLDNPEKFQQNLWICFRQSYNLTHKLQSSKFISEHTILKDNVKFKKSMNNFKTSTCMWTVMKGLNSKTFTTPQKVFEVWKDSISQYGRTCYKVCRGCENANNTTALAMLGKGFGLSVASSCFSIGTGCKDPTPRPKPLV